MRLLKGEIERLNEYVVAGWVLDENNPGEKLELEIFIEQAQVGECVACEFRPDFTKLHHRAGQHAFLFVFPRAINHQISTTVDIRIKGEANSIPGMPHEYMPRCIAGYTRSGEVIEGFAFDTVSSRHVTVQAKRRSPSPGEIIEIEANRVTSLPACFGFHQERCGFRLSLAELGINASDADSELELWIVEPRQRIAPLTAGRFLDQTYRCEVEVDAQLVSGWVSCGTDELRQIEVRLNGKLFLTPVTRRVESERGADRRNLFNVKLPSIVAQAKPFWLTLHAFGRKRPFYVHQKPLAIIKPCVSIVRADHHALEGVAYVPHGPLCPIQLMALINGREVDINLAQGGEFKINTAGFCNGDNAGNGGVPYQIALADERVALGRLKYSTKFAEGLIVTFNEFNERKIELQFRQTGKGKQIPKKVCLEVAVCDFPSPHSRPISA